MKKILVSACLFGNNCRYKGDNCLNEKLLAIGKDNVLIPVCPEQLGGLSTPRRPAERVGDKIISDKGVDVTGEYTRGAELAVMIAKANNVDYCVRPAEGALFTTELSPAENARGTALPPKNSSTKGLSYSPRTICKTPSQIYKYNERFAAGNDCETFYFVYYFVPKIRSPASPNAVTMYPCSLRGASA